MLPLAKLSNGFLILLTCSSNPLGLQSVGFTLFHIKITRENESKSMQNLEDFKRFQANI
jgi:hypothetical protein